MLSCISARTGEKNPTAVEQFKNQVGCLNFPDNFHSYDGKTGQRVFGPGDPGHMTQTATGESCCTVNRTLSCRTRMLVQLHTSALLSQLFLSVVFLFQSCALTTSRAAAERQNSQDVAALFQVSFSSIINQLLMTNLL